MGGNSSKGGGGGGGGGGVARESMAADAAGDGESDEADARPKQDVDYREHARCCGCCLPKHATAHQKKNMC
eukprot:SAG22_NODE_7608_length_724_cov_2.323200_2_plen_71_part_00